MACARETGTLSLPPSPGSPLPQPPPPPLPPCWPFLPPSPFMTSPGTCLYCPLPPCPFPHFLPPPFAPFGSGPFTVPFTFTPCPCEFTPCMPLAQVIFFTHTHTVPTHALPHPTPCAVCLLIGTPSCVCKLGNCYSQIALCPLACHSFTPTPQFPWAKTAIPLPLPREAGDFGGTGTCTWPSGPHAPVRTRLPFLYPLPCIIIIIPPSSPLIIYLFYLPLPLYLHLQFGMEDDLSLVHGSRTGQD